MKRVSFKPLRRFSLTSHFKRSFATTVQTQIVPSLEKVSRPNEVSQDLYQGGNKDLKEIDEQVYNIIKNEQYRQFNGLELIASENFTSTAVMQTVGSCLTNKYSEGLPGARYYGGNEFIDELEILCQERALEVFGLNPTEWGVNVQSYSGSTANFSAFGAFLEPGDRFMGLHLPDGGHLSHGFYNAKRKVNGSARYFTSLPYHVNPETGFIDYDQLERDAKNFCPKMIIAGASAYPRDWDYRRFREICDSVNAYLMADIAHYSGLIASGLMNSPFAYADFVTTTTHKSLRATRAAIIFAKKQYMDDVDFSVFPSSQGGPHNHAIGGIAVALKEAMSSHFREYSKQTIQNAKALADELMQLGQKVATNGTDNHLILWDLRPQSLSGAKCEYACELAHITVNKNTVHGDKSAVNPGGIRIGTPALTTRELKENDMRKVAKFLHEICEISKKIDEDFKSRHGKKPKVAEFKELAQQSKDIVDVGLRVKAFASQFPMPGVILD